MGAEALLKYRLTPVVSNFDQIAKLKDAVNETALYPVHLKFNTGMQRLGFDPADATRAAHEIKKDSFLKVEGVCTHFSSGEDFGDSNGSTIQQVSDFQKVISDIKKQIQDPILFHYLNSAAILTRVEPQLDVARPGITLYGALPKLKPGVTGTVKPVMSVKSFVGFIHRLHKGAKVSYGGTWQAPKDSVISVVPMGYADGIPRLASNKGQVLIRGQMCPMVGTICMDYIMVDVTHLAESNIGPVIGDEVVIIGTQQKNTITAQDLGVAAQTSSYEILTGMQGRLPRIYVH